MSNINELLKHEEDVIAVSRRVFEAFSPELIEALDTAIGMYTTFGRIVGQDSDSTADVREVNEVGQALGAKDDTDLDRIRATPTSDPLRASLLARLEAAEDRLEARLDRGVILLQMQRAFSRCRRPPTAATDVGGWLPASSCRRSRSSLPHPRRSGQGHRVAHGSDG